MARERGLDAVRQTVSTATDRALKLWLPDAADRFSVAELTEPPPPVEFVIQPYLPLGCAAILTGAGGTNKTGLMTLFAIHVCTGDPLFGSSVMSGGVLYISAEDRRQVLRRHVYANAIDLDDLQRQRISERLHVKDAVGTGFKITRHIDAQTTVAEDVGQLIEYAKDIPDLRLICLDTLSRLNGGEETNEDLARFVEGMERISRETGAAVIAAHHSGKAQMRADANDQYSGRGGSSLSDNARSVLHMTTLTPDAPDVPTNALELVGYGRLRRLSHVKSNYARASADRYLEVVLTEHHAARLMEFAAEFGKDDLELVWQHIAEWLETEREVKYPTARTIDSLGPKFGSRADRRRAVDWALDRGRLLEHPHPDPQGKRRKYYALPPSVSVAAAAYRGARDRD